MPLDSITRYGVVASCKPWGKEVFDYLSARDLGFEWFFVSDNHELYLIDNNYEIEIIFFVHWSSFVPASITSKVKCLCLHMTDLPYGRGGSPLQNLILRGHTSTKLTIFQMNSELDAGPIYVQKVMPLHGSALEIYLRMVELSKTMFEQVLIKDLAPAPQRGIPTIFRRRKPFESELPLLSNLESIYNFIRMLDAPTYPAAYVNYGDLRISFSNANFEGGQLSAFATFELKEFLSGEK